MVLKYLPKKKCVICGNRCDYVGKTNIKEVYSIQIRDIIRALGKYCSLVFIQFIFLKIYLQEETVKLEFFYAESIRY